MSIQDELRDAANNPPMRTSGLLHVAATRIDQLEKELIEVRKDAERLNALDTRMEAYGFEHELYGYKWEISGPFTNVRAAIDKAMERK